MKRGAAILLAGAALLAWSAWTVVMSGAAAPSPGPAIARLAPVRPPALLSRRDRHADAEAVLARPLFAPTRRPSEAAPTLAAAPASLPRLSGVLLNGPNRSAIFAPLDGGRPVVAQVGGQLGAYTIQSIAAGRVVVMGPGGTKVLRPSFESQGARPMPASPSILAGAGADAGNTPLALPPGSAR